MPDREKVIKGLQELHGSQETMELISSALSLLKEQETEIEKEKRHICSLIANTVVYRDEVIMCKDCKFFCKEEKALVANQYCGILRRGVRSDWFCADGERKEGR